MVFEALSKLVVHNLFSLDNSENSGLKYRPTFGGNWIKTLCPSSKTATGFHGAEPFIL
jgi:hypothetical protein